MPVKDNIIISVIKELPNKFRPKQSAGLFRHAGASRFLYEQKLVTIHFCETMVWWEKKGFKKYNGKNF